MNRQGDSNIPPLTLFAGVLLLFIMYYNIVLKILELNIFHLSQISNFHQFKTAIHRLLSVYVVHHKGR